MKTGVISLLIGITGLVIVTYSYYMATLEYSEPWSGQNLVTLFTMNYTARITLVILEVVGAVSGFLAYKKWKAKVGLLGMGLSTLSLILLLYYPL